MIRRSFAVLLAALTAACGVTSHPTLASPMSLVPHTEYQQLEAEGPSEYCGVYLGEWNASEPGCYVSLTHCSRDALNRTCTSMADEHRLACDERASFCGVPVRCDCPEVAPSIVHPPGTITLVPGRAGESFGPASCLATPREDETAARFSICSIAIHDCTDGDCVERREDVSAGARATVCGSLVRCVAP